MAMFKLRFVPNPFLRMAWVHGMDLVHGMAWVLGMDWVHGMD